MYYFKLTIEKSAINFITEKLKDFVFNKDVYVEFLNITTSKYFYDFKKSVSWLIFHKDCAQLNQTIMVFFCLFSN